MVRFVVSDGCRHKQLAAHFGQQLDACNVSCDRCSATLVGGSSARTKHPARQVLANYSPEPALVARFDRLPALRRRLAQGTCNSGVPDLHR
jgi:hypothetical protein